MAEGVAGRLREYRSLSQRLKAYSTAQALRGDKCLCTFYLNSCNLYQSGIKFLASSFHSVEVLQKKEWRRPVREQGSIGTSTSAATAALQGADPSLKYCSHVWGCVPKNSLKLLDTIQKRPVSLIDTPILTKDLHSLEYRRRVAGLSLFYRFYHGRCSSELSH
nr:unnamed protein product [Callosobruchus analis]